MQGGKREGEKELEEGRNILQLYFEIEFPEGRGC
jgi:hypothetical protein